MENLTRTKSRFCCTYLLITTVDVGMQHIVDQLEVLTRTVSLFENRLSHTEDKVCSIFFLLLLQKEVYGACIFLG
jgi:hypothetical protein